MSNEQELGSLNQNREWYFQHPKQMYQGLLSGSSSTLYTTPAKGAQGPPPKAMVTEILVTNVHSAALAVTVYFVPVGGSAGDSTTIIPAVTFPANSITRIDLQTILEESGTIRGFAGTANKINLTISGIEFLLAKA